MWIWILEWNNLLQISIFFLWNKTAATSCDLNCSVNWKKKGCNVSTIYPWSTFKYMPKYLFSPGIMKKEHENRQTQSLIMSTQVIFCDALHLRSAELQGGPKNYPTFRMPISHEQFKLSQWKSNQIKDHSILFRMMYTFITMRAIEMV